MKLIPQLNNMFTRNFILHNLSMEIARAVSQHWTPIQLEQMAIDDVQIWQVVEQEWLDKVGGKHNLIVQTRQGRHLLGGVTIKTKDVVDRLAIEVPAHTVVIERHMDWFTHQTAKIWERFLAYANAEV